MRKLLGIVAIASGLSLFVAVQLLLSGRSAAVMADEMIVAPVIAVDPSALATEQTPDTLVTQTLTIQNLGDSELEWHLYEESVGLWEQTDNMSTGNGAPSQYFPDLSQGGYAADDFVVPAGQTWLVDEIFVPGLYTLGDGPAPDFDVTVYEDASGLPGMGVVSVTAVIPLSDDNGDITLDLTTPLVLPAGNYWLSVNANMNFGMQDQWFWRTRTVQRGAPYHWLETGVFGTSCDTGWQPGATVCGVGGGVDPDLVFALRGSYSGGECDTLSNLPWVNVTPLTGTVAVSGTMPLSVTFDSSGYVPGVYTGTLCVISNDSVQPSVSVPLTMTVITPTYGVVVGPDDSGVNLPGEQIHYELSVMNTGNTADIYTLTVTSTWTTTLSVSSLALAGGASETVMVTVTVPLTAADGQMDTAVVTAVSQTAPGLMDSAVLTSTVGMPPPKYGIYLPFLRK